MSIEEIYQEMVQAPPPPQKPPRPVGHIVPISHHQFHVQSSFTSTGFPFTSTSPLMEITPAAQVYGLYVQADWVGRQCFPQTAQGEFLDRHAQLRGGPAPSR